VMGIEALVPRPGTSKAAPGHKIYPYLLRGLKIVEPNHVWAADVTYSAPRPGWSGVHIAGMLMRKEKKEGRLALCCERA
jgi:putative transposase